MRSQTGVWERGKVAVAPSELEMIRDPGSHSCAHHFVISLAVGYVLSLLRSLVLGLSWERGKGQQGPYQ